LSLTLERKQKEQTNEHKVLREICWLKIDSRSGKCRVLYCIKSLNYVVFLHYVCCVLIGMATWINRNGYFIKSVKQINCNIQIICYKDFACIKFADKLF
jgi:hypothetical protein